MRYFCTYFDSNYLPRGLALYRSLERHAAPFRLWVLCFDDAAYETLRGLALPGLEPIALAEFEKGDDALLAAKANRNRFEYYFTCTPSLALYVLRQHPEVDVVTYLDADLYFFAGPAPVEAEFGSASILIIGHRFPAGSEKKWEANGIYNVGYLSFRRDAAGLACLGWWRDRCLEWCYDRIEEGRFADQKYLDDWPQRFPGVVALSHPGANLAPWNVAQYSLAWQGGRVLVDGRPLIFYHFHKLSPVGPWVYDPDLKTYGVQAGAVLKRHVYAPYVAELRTAQRWLAAHGAGPRRTAGGADRSHAARGNRGRGPEMRLRSAFWHLRRLIRGEIWAAPGGRLL